LRKRHWLTKSSPRHQVSFDATWRDYRLLDPARVVWRSGDDDFLKYPAIAISCRFILPFLFVRRLRALFPQFEIQGRGDRVSILTCWQSLKSFAVRPDYLSYFNQAAGGPEEAIGIGR